MNKDVKGRGKHQKAWERLEAGIKHLKHLQCSWKQEFLNKSESNKLTCWGVFRKCVSPKVGLHQLVFIVITIITGLYLDSCVCPTGVE